MNDQTLPADGICYKCGHLQSRHTGRAALCPAASVGVVTTFQRRAPDPLPQVPTGVVPPVKCPDRRLHLSEAPAAPRAHGHYFKSVAHLAEVDVYRVLELFSITDQALGHALKKLLVAGGRGGGKDITRDVKEAVDTLNRWIEMRAEDVTT